MRHPGGFPVRGRERKIVRAAIRAGYEALARLEGPADLESVAQALRALLDGQIALLEALEPGGERDIVPPPAPAPVPLPVPVPDPAPAPPAPPEAPGAPGPGIAGADLAHGALAAFPLEDMNRWLVSGTVFQIRGAFAFLNMNSMGGMRIDEMSGNIKKMGFGEALGRLEAHGLGGEILLFRRPESP